MTHAQSCPAPEPAALHVPSVRTPQVIPTFHREYLNLLDHVRPVRERAERLRWSVFARAAALCEQAGLDPSSAGTQLHNCLIDAERGRAWTGVDAALAHRSQELYRRQFDGYRVYERYFLRLELELRARWTDVPHAA